MRAPLRSQLILSKFSRLFRSKSIAEDDGLWRKRLLAYSAARIGGLAIFFVGLAIIYTNLLRDGGWPQVGAVVAILGVLDALFAPRMLKKLWDQQDREK